MASARARLNKQDFSKVRVNRDKIDKAEEVLPDSGMGIPLLDDPGRVSEFFQAGEGSLGGGGHTYTLTTAGGLSRGNRKYFSH